MIGFFDSGLGGLSVLNNFHLLLPQYHYIYYADSINSPYGNKNKAEIYNLSKKAIEFLFLSGANLVIVSCNTVSASVLRELQDNYFSIKYPSKKVLGIIIPNVENIIETIPHSSNMGIIATTHTIKTNKYNLEISKTRKDINIYPKACPKFATFVEENKINSPIFLANFKKELAFFENKNIKYLLLACTHYSFIKNEINTFFDNKIVVIDSSDIILNKTLKYLKKHKYLKLTKDRITVFYVNGNLNSFKAFTRNYLFLKNRKIEYLKSPILSNN